jgi:hypothetical protein
MDEAGCSNEPIPAGLQVVFNGPGAVASGVPSRFVLVGSEIEPGQDATSVPGENLPVPGQKDLDLDLLSAAIRADASDTDSFFRVLAAKLAEALGDRVVIKREGGLFKRDKPAVGIKVDLATGAGVVLEANRNGGGIDCLVSRPVRGIVVSSKQVTLPEWVDNLAKALASEAQQSEQTWAALHGLLA